MRAVSAASATTTSKGPNMKNGLILGLALLVVTAVCATAEDAKTLYEKGCAKCHGDDGKGQTTMGKKLEAKDYTDAKVQDALKDEAAIKAIKEGLKSADGSKTLMKPAEGLTDEDIKGLVKYMRGFKK
jgi:cytochrome c553